MLGGSAVSMVPNMSLISLTFIVSVATSYTVLILIEYIRKRKPVDNIRQTLMGAIALGSGLFAMHLIGILTFMAEYQFTPRYWLLGLAFISACLSVALLLRILGKPLAGRRTIWLSAIFAGFFGKAAYFLTVSGMFDVKFASMSPLYYLLSVMIVIVVCFLGYRFIQQIELKPQTETRRITNAFIIGAVLTLLYYTSMNTFYTEAALPAPATEGMWAVNIAVAVAAVVALLLVSSINLAQVDMRAMHTESKLLSQVRESEKRFRTLAYTDQLTGMPNRHWFFYHLRELMTSEQQDVQSVTVVLLDFDDFKSINELLGHDGADQFLKTVVCRLNNVLPNGVQLARLGGDEFVFAIPDASTAQIEKLCQVILAEMQQPVAVGARRITSSLSMGISCQQQVELNEEDLIKQADVALFMAKSRGKENFEFFSTELLDGSIRKQEIAAALQQALLNGEFSVHYQPQVELSNGRIIGFEALLRWNSALGAVSPAEFIPIAEECGAIHSIGEWVLREACLQLKSWREEGRPDIRVSVNVSAKQFRDPEFAQKVERILIETKVPPKFVEIEITESLMLDIGTAAELLQELKAIGVNLAIDDFGTGYSSLNAVKNIQVDTLKIDKSLVDEVLGSDRSMAILTTIIELGRNLGAEVVVEGLETIDQVALMRQYEVIGQGYYFSRPLPADKASKVWDKYLEQPNGMFRAPILY